MAQHANVIKHFDGTNNLCCINAHVQTYLRTTNNQLPHLLCFTQVPLFDRHCCPCRPTAHQGAMFVPLMLIISLTSLAIPGGRGTEETKGTPKTKETAELGKAINRAKTNLLEDFKEREASIFEAFPSQCYKKENLNSTRSHFEYYQNTKSFYSKLASQAGLDASLESAYSLSATLNSVTQKTSSRKSNVSRISLIVEA